MNNFEKAASNIGNRFELVLVASERMREIHRKRMEQEELGIIDTLDRKNKTPPCVQAISDIESGLVSREYLNRVSSRNKKQSRYKW
jgi:DNA-directed RNA polymerase omega subunit